LIEDDRFELLLQKNNLDENESLTLRGIYVCFIFIFMFVLF